jgi:hypothetical protein
VRTSNRVGSVAHAGAARPVTLDAVGVDTNACEEGRVSPRVAGSERETASEGDANEHGHVAGLPCLGPERLRLRFRVCAVPRCESSVGDSPTRQQVLLSVATQTAKEVTILLKLWV